MKITLRIPEELAEKLVKASELFSMDESEIVRRVDFWE